jgi:hypothetical protein
MLPIRRWSHRAATVLAAFSVLGVLHAVTLLALGIRGAPTLGLALLAVAYAAAAGRSAQLLRRRALDRLPAWLALWVGSTLAVLGVIGTTFRPHAMFWWSAVGASLAWLGLGLWLGRRVVAEARGAKPAGVSPSAERAGAGAVAPSPNESLQLTEAHSIPAALEAPASRLRN